MGYGLLGHLGFMKSRRQRCQWSDILLLSLAVSPLTNKAKRRLAVFVVMGKSGSFGIRRALQTETATEQGVRDGGVTMYTMISEDARKQRVNNKSKKGNHRSFLDFIFSLTLTWRSYWLQYQNSMADASRASELKDKGNRLFAEGRYKE